MSLGRHAALFAALALAVSACASAPIDTPSLSSPSLLPALESEPGVYLRAERERVAQLTRDVERLAADLVHAEQTIVAAESGVTAQSRPVAIAAIAGARIGVKRAGKRAPWRAAELREARSKLEDAELRAQAGHFDSAVFFAARAEHIAADIEREADSAEQDPSARFIRGRRVNLRAGPSTQDSVLRVLVAGTPVFPERSEGRWVLVRTVSGNVGWVHGSLIGPLGGARPLSRGR